MNKIKHTSLLIICCFFIACSSTSQEHKVEKTIDTSGINWNIDDSIVYSYFQEKPVSDYANHWIYYMVGDGEHQFETPPFDRISEIKECYEQVIRILENFTFRNEALVNEVFVDDLALLESVNIIFTVGMPSMYDAFVCQYEGVYYITLDVVNFANYIQNGHDVSELLSNFVTHEVVHILMKTKYPYEEMTYKDYLDYVAFHEGFAHLLSYKEDIADYELDDSYGEKFNTSQNNLVKALNETDPAMQRQYLYEANTGRYWDKFAAISSMLFLLNHQDSLKEIYYHGWRGYTDLIVKYEWNTVTYFQ